MSASKTSDSYADLRVAVATVATSLREAQGILGRLVTAADEQVVKDLDDSVRAACNYLDATETALASDAGTAVPVVLEFGTFVHEGFDASDQMEELAQVGSAHPELQADTQQLEISLGKVREAAGQLMLVIQGQVAEHYAASYRAPAQRPRLAAASTGDPPSVTEPVPPEEPASPEQGASGQQGLLGPSSPSIPVPPDPSAGSTGGFRMPSRSRTASGRRGKSSAGAGASATKPASGASSATGGSGAASASGATAAASTRSSRSGPGRSWDSDDLVEAVQGLAVMLASQQTHGPTETSRGAGTYEAVADQMSATLDAFGLPHDGVQLGYDGNADYARDRLIEGLRRNFASKNRDGFTVYYRVDDPSPANAPAPSSQLLRGGALVNANLFEAEAKAYLATLDRLVPRTRFTSATGVFDPTAARRQIKDELGRLQATISDPLGANQAQAHFQLRRVLTETVEYLELAEILEEDLAERLVSMRALERVIDDGDLVAPTSVVRREELTQDLNELFKLLISMHYRIDTVVKRGQKGNQAAQLEQALTAALTAAASFDALLVRSGTSPLEQELQYVTVPAPHGAGDLKISLRQFLSWVQATAEPFTHADNLAATLLREDLDILAEELDALVEAATAFLRHGQMQRFSVRLPAPLRQLQELRYLLQEAASAAEALNQPASA